MTDLCSVEKAIVVRNLEKTFGNFIAVNRISFEVGKGMIFGFLGPNGAGKSTTIRMLCGILAPTSGDGLISGLDIVKDHEKIKSNIGYMSQKFSLYDDLTVEENIDFFSGIYSVPNHLKKGRKEWVLESSSLQNLRDVLTSTLSAGWKQRLALGCAILHEPPILFLDEPTAGVDAISRRHFWNLIDELSQKGTTIFVTTHYMDEAEYCDKVALIFEGNIIAQGTPEYLKSHAMSHKVIEVICENELKASDLLKKLPFVKDLSIFGKAIHVTLKDHLSAILAIKECLDSEEILTRSIKEIQPSFEDIFISLIDEREEGL